MNGCYDFCAHYEWTFEWLRREGGDALVNRFWEEAISRDSQRHAWKLIVEKGVEGMKEYWAYTLQEEAAAFTTVAGDGFFRLDMHQCPSKGFLLDNELYQFKDYCDHCIGWIGPLMKEAGFSVHHQHNHRGNCWWEFHAVEQTGEPSEPGELAGSNDARLMPGWDTTDTPIDTFIAAHSAREKTP